MEGTYINLLSNNYKDLDITYTKDTTFFKNKNIRSKILSYETHEEKINKNIKYGNMNTIDISDIGDLLNGIITKIEISKSVIDYKYNNEIKYINNKYKNINTINQYEINKKINNIDRIKLIIEEDVNIIYKNLKYNIIREYNKTNLSDIIVNYFVNKNKNNILLYTDVINDYYKYINLIKEYIFS